MKQSPGGIYTFSLIDFLIKLRYGTGLLRCSVNFAEHRLLPRWSTDWRSYSLVPGIFFAGPRHSPSPIGTPRGLIHWSPAFFSPIGPPDGLIRWSPAFFSPIGSPDGLIRWSPAFFSPIGPPRGLIRWSPAFFSPIGPPGGLIRWSPAYFSPIGPPDGLIRRKSAASG